MGKLDGRTAIVTGASRGMGSSHARRFIAEGAKVVLTDLRSDAGSALAQELGPNAKFIEHDVTNAADWTRVVAAAEDFFGPINVLVNNAGILGVMAKTADVTEADYRKVCEVNQHSVYLGMHAVIPSMLKGGRGSIVNISSIAGLVANYGFPSLAYVASKFAVRGMTPMMVEATDEGGGEALLQIPLRRIAEPEEVSNLVLFLACDESSYITGAEHVIDAGMTAQ